MSIDDLSSLLSTLANTLKILFDVKYYKDYDKKEP